MVSGQFQNVGSFVRNCANSTLRYDEACLRIISDENVTFSMQYDDCEGCKLLETASVAGLKYIKLHTLSPLRYAVESAQGHICNGEPPTPTDTSVTPTSMLTSRWSPLPNSLETPPSVSLTEQQPTQTLVREAANYTPLAPEWVNIRRPKSVLADEDDDLTVRVQELMDFSSTVLATNPSTPQGTYHFGEFGQYDLNITSGKEEQCVPKMTAEPDAAYLPILGTVVSLLAMATFWYLVKGIGKRVVAGRFYARYFAREDNELGSETRVLTTESSVPRPPTRPRLRSLDIFRGASIAMMIFVNSGGGGYAIFRHSVWNGLTIADVVFPCFAFAMGEALVLSLNARLRTAMTRTTALMQVARRSLFLSVIGLLLGSFEATWDTIRLPGVLQRLAAMYLIVGALECGLMKVSADLRPGSSLFRDIWAGWMQWLATLTLVALQIIITFTVAAPGCPRGYVGPGGLHMSENGQNLTNCTGGIAGYIDRLILGPNHLYHGGLFKHVYQTTIPFDPEGILGCLSGLLVVQAGAHATRIMLAYNHARARIMRWVIWSVIFSLTGGALCLFSKNAGPIPINKNLWSLSFCLVTAGIGMFLQAVLYYAVDLKTKWGGRPLYYAGQNALIIYIGSELLKRHFPFYLRLEFPTHTQLLVTHAATTLIWLAVAIALYKRRIFISV